MMPAATGDSFGLRMSNGGGIQMIWVWQRNAELTWKDMKRYEKNQGRFQLDVSVKSL